MFSSGISTSVAESVAAGEIRSLCGAAGLQTAVEVDEHVVITASSVGSRILQAEAAAKQKPVPECLLKSTEAISSSRLYSNIQTQNTEQRRRDEMGTEKTERKEILLSSKQH